MDTVVLCKAVDFGKLLGVIDKVLHTLAILRSKVLGHTFKTLEHTFADGDAGHHDDELGPAIDPVQFKHGLDVGIGLTRTRFHFNGQCQSLALQLLNRFQPLCHLNAPNIVAETITAQGYRRVSKPLHFIQSSNCTLVHQKVAQAITLRLS